jgi:hypothetical protein
MRTRVRLETRPAPESRFAAERIICEALAVDLAGARRVLEHYPTLLPITQSEASARELATRLAEAGLPTSLVTIPEGTTRTCVFHPRFMEGAVCRDCSRPLCLICERKANAGTCVDCRTLAVRRKRNQRVRVAVLLSILLGVCLLGVKEWKRRNLGWDRSHRIAVVLVQDPNAPLSEELRVAFAKRASVVEQALAHQRQSFSPNSAPPVSLTVLGPIDELYAPPTLETTGLVDLLTFNVALARYAEAHDDALSLKSSLFDVRIYVRAKDASDAVEAAEGLGQQKGRVGVVSTRVSLDGIDFAWFVVMHEYLHTRGATDKYGPDGRAVYPMGFADPTLVPPIPQTRTELMARGRRENETEEDLPGEPDTWVIGKWTAEEIGW